MNDEPDDPTLAQAKAWWTSSIVDMRPGVIRFRGYAIEELIGRVGYAQMVWLMLRGELPTAAQAGLLESALVAAVDHGPLAPSIATARMAVTCGLPLNGAMASAINMLDDVHGGAGEQAMALYADIAARCAAGAALTAATATALQVWQTVHDRYIPGFGHRFHPIDPRAPRLLALVDLAARAGTVTGRFAEIGRAVEALLADQAGKTVTMNIDGATAVIFAELGFPAPLGRGLFLLSRAVGILAHAWEQKQQGGRIKGPMPPDFLYRYDGPPARPLGDAGG
ncbi:MAG: citryl-CoA lyase [Betaproteobacteria bacterium]|nr:citryl-CoA lyase [Betaproteobacteria bacterium]